MDFLFCECFCSVVDGNNEFVMTRSCHSARTCFVSQTEEYISTRNTAKRIRDLQQEHVKIF